MRSIDSIKRQRRRQDNEKFAAALEVLGPLRVWYRPHGGKRKGGNWWLATGDRNRQASKAEIVAEAERLGRKK